MNIRRGTTPVINVSTGDHDWSHFQTVHMTFRDVFNRRAIVDKYMEDLTFSVDGDGNNIITCTLSQKDTLLFTPNKRVRLHLRGVDENGYAQGSEIAVMNVDDCLLNKVIDPYEDRKHGHETNPIYSCTVEVGTVENLPAGATPYVRNDGTDRNAVFSFGLVRGAQGERGADGQPGQPGRDGIDGSDGSDGITPTVEITNITGGHNVAFVYGEDDPRNTDTDIMDGVAGQPGQPGRDGTDGTDGTDGVDGITPTVTITNISGGHNVAFNYGSGDSRNRDFDVLDGVDGKDGADGKDGKDGADGDSMFTVIETHPTRTDVISVNAHDDQYGNIVFSWPFDAWGVRVNLDETTTYMVEMIDINGVMHATPIMFTYWPSPQTYVADAEFDNGDITFQIEYNAAQASLEIATKSSDWADNVVSVTIFTVTGTEGTYLETIDTYDGVGPKFGALIEAVVNGTVGVVLNDSY